MMVANTSGSSFEYAFNGRAIGLFVIAGPDAGIIEYSIDDGPQKQLDLFTKWSQGLNIPWAYMLDTDLAPGNHLLKLSISTQNNKQSSGHALRIRNFLINE